MIEIVIMPLGLKAPGRFEARHGERIILKSSRQPLLDAARVFLAEGIAPDTRISMRHADSPHVALSSSIGAAAKLTVRETPKNGPYFVQHQPYDPGEWLNVASPMRKTGQGAPG